jgi:hypothetical protein
MLAFLALAGAGSHSGLRVRAAWLVQQPVTKLTAKAPHLYVHAGKASVRTGWLPPWQSHVVFRTV